MKFMYIFKQGLVSDRLVLDPSAAEKMQCSSSMTIAALAASNEIVAVYMEGDFMSECTEEDLQSRDLLQKAFSLGLSSCNQMRSAVRDCLTESRVDDKPE